MNANERNSYARMTEQARHGKGVLRFAQDAAGAIYTWNPRGNRVELHGESRDRWSAINRARQALSGENKKAVFVIGEPDPSLLRAQGASRA